MRSFERHDAITGELFVQIYRDARARVRQLARKRQVGRAKVRQSLVSAETPTRNPRIRMVLRLGPFNAAFH